MTYSGEIKQQMAKRDACCLLVGCFDESRDPKLQIGAKNFQLLAYSRRFQNNYMGNVFVYSNAIFSSLLQIVFDKYNTDAFLPAKRPQISKAGTFQDIMTRTIEYCQDFVIARGSFKTTVFHLMIQKVFDEQINRRLLAEELHMGSKFVQAVRFPGCSFEKLFEITAILKKFLCRTIFDETIKHRLPKAVKINKFFETRLKNDAILC